MDSSSFSRPTLAPVSLRIGLLAVSLLLVLNAGDAAGGAMDEFIDPTDGQFDASTFLLNKRGFLLNPMVLTEPSIGYGGGATLLFFHGSKDEEREEGEVLGLPPSVSFALGGATETSSWFTGAGHFGSFLGDRVRYLGAGGYASLNIDFYIGSHDLDYSIDGYFILQQLDFRLGDSNFFLGGKYVYSRLESEFDLGPVLPAFLPEELTFDSSGVGPVLKFDSRDNIFTANSGIELEVSPVFYSEALGSDGEYQMLETHSRIYSQVHEKLVLAARVDTQSSFGNVPFYALPSIRARGVPVTRYQNEYSVSSEVQGRWNVFRRWSLIGFVGLGWAGGDIEVLDDNKVVPSGGGGFRYLIARLLNIQTGMDFAGSEDEFAFYFQIGTGW
jgi:hypothetical protein